VTPIRAAGGVVWRSTAEGIKVCLVHRPRYDDWSLPKGKLESGEHPLLAAVREVAEESDVRAVPQVRLPSVRYTSEGRPKVVDFWSMWAAGSGGFEAETEVDGVRWLSVEAAIGLVSYPHDAGVLRVFAALPPVTTVLTLVRHAQAGKRATWSGPDSARPLDEIGRARARSLAPLLALTRPERLLSASPRRCVQTLDPLAELVDQPIEVDSYFDEPKPGQDLDENALAAAGRLAELAMSGTPAAVCSQGKVIPEALARLANTAADYPTEKGGAWLLAFTPNGLLSTDRL
jgi:broad specificity phosphatase PhoE/ADP-ribose pyrophosphatase YjhB (NUDIX family)